MRSFLILISSILPFFSQASAATDELEISASTYHHSCGSYSNTESDISIRLSHVIASDDKITAHVGFGGVDSSHNRDEAFKWSDVENVPATTNVQAEHQFKLTKIIMSRGSPISITSIQVVFKVTHADGSTTWIHPSEGDMSYTQAILRDDHSQIMCVSPGSRIPAPVVLESSIIN